MGVRQQIIATRNRGTGSRAHANHSSRRYPKVPSGITAGHHRPVISPRGSCLAPSRSNRPQRILSECFAPCPIAYRNNNAPSTAISCSLTPVSPDPSFSCHPDAHGARKHPRGGTPPTSTAWRLPERYRRLQLSHLFAEASAALVVNVAVALEHRVVFLIS